MLEVLAGLVGRPVDPKKSEDEKLQMVALGVEITADCAVFGVKAALQEIKAKAWNKAALCRGIFEPADAAQLAGRLNFAVTASASKSRRAYMKPVHAHSARPVCGPVVWFLLRTAL